MYPALRELLQRRAKGVKGTLTPGGTELDGGGGEVKWRAGLREAVCLVHGRAQEEEAGLLWRVGSLPAKPWAGKTGSEVELEREPCEPQEGDGQGGTWSGFCPVTTNRGT